MNRIHLVLRVFVADEICTSNYSDDLAIIRFIFITPREMSNLNYGPTAKILQSSTVDKFSRNLVNLRFYKNIEAQKRN